MKTVGKLSVVLILILLFGSCSFQEKKLKKRHSTSTLIHIDPAKASRDSIPMSLIAERIEYIPLQMTDSSVLSYPYDFKVTNAFIFIREGNCILKFSKDGRFIKRLFDVGYGPGESKANSFAINESDNLVYAYDVHSRRGNIYDFDGMFIKTFNEDLCDPLYWISSIDYFQSNIFVSICLRPGVSYLFSSFDLKDDSVRVLYKTRNTFTASQEQQVPMIVFGNQHQVTQSEILFKERYCDTIFAVDKDFHLRPLYIIDLGKDKMLWEDFRDQGMFNISAGPPDGYWIESFADTHSFLFLMAKSFKDPGLLCVYLKDSDSTVVSSNKSYITQEQRLVYMKNDLDYLVPFPPMRKQTGQFLYHEEYLYSVIEAKDFVAAYNAASTEKRTSSEYLRKMEPLFSKIDEFSNPVIMKVHLK